MMRSRSRMIPVLAAFAAVGMILGYIESFIVLPVNVPGIRIGFANTACVMVLYLFGPFAAGTVQFVRVVLSALLFGSPISLAYSLTGAAFSLAAMIAGKRFGFSVYGVSILGAVFHNIAQTVTAVFFTGSIYVLMYIPALMIAGVLTGTLIGFLSDILMKRLRNVIINEREELK